MACRGQASGDSEVTVSTVVNCSSECCISPGEVGRHVVRMRNFGPTSIQVDFRAIFDQGGPLGYRTGAVWHQQLCLPPSRTLQRCAEECMSENISHMDATQSATGSIHQLKLFVSITRSRHKPENVGEIPISLICT